MCSSDLDWPEGEEAPSPWVGVLAIRCDQNEDTWLQFWRLEQIETVRWGGRPEKTVTAGPLGPRLTPRGSFEEWKETVSGCAVPWTAHDQECAHELLHALHKAMSARMSELDRAKNQMLAILGHDLRDPLHSISMAAQIMTRECVNQSGPALLRYAADLQIRARRQIKQSVAIINRRLSNRACFAGGENSACNA